MLKNQNRQTFAFLVIFFHQQIHFPQKSDLLDVSNQSGHSRNSVCQTSWRNQQIYLQTLLPNACHRASSVNFTADITDDIIFKQLRQTLISSVYWSICTFCLLVFQFPGFEDSRDLRQKIENGQSWYCFEYLLFVSYSHQQVGLFLSIHSLSLRVYILNTASFSNLEVFLNQQGQCSHFLDIGWSWLPTYHYFFD